MRAMLDTDRARVLRRAAVLATRAPSLLNTQPWRFVLRESVLELHADPGRRLQQLDPVLRHLHVACGCALLNARVALAAERVPAVVQRLPDPARPDLIATVTIGAHAATWRSPDRSLAGFADAVFDRRTARHGFAAGPPGPLRLPAMDGVVVSTLGGAEAEKARFLLEVAALDQRDEVGSTTETTVVASADATVVLFSTLDDSRESWVRAGEAYERVALDLATRQLSAVPYTQVIENALTRQMLTELSPQTGIPQLMAQIGRAAPTPMSRRRLLVDMLDQGM